MPEPLTRSSVTQSSRLTQPADTELQLRLKNTYSGGIFWRGHHALAPRILYFRGFDSFDRELMLKVTASAHSLFNGIAMNLVANGGKCGLFEI